MRITILMENSDGENGCAFEHGLSVHVETGSKNILADTGASDKLLFNADRLGIDLSKVDLLTLSHGHYDHAGGILAFYERNQTAPIYMQKSAGEAYYSDDRFIGIDPRILNLPTLRVIDGGKYPEGRFVIDPEAELLFGVKARRFWPEGNRVMFKETGGIRQPDSFDHEQSLVIHGEKELLICGCAHCGILNILDQYRRICQRDPDIVIGGFHMMKKTEYTEAEAGTVINTAEELAKMKTVFYTGHCTGGKALRLMQPILKDRLVPMYSGMQIII